MSKVPTAYRTFARVLLPDGGQIVLVTGHTFGDICTLHDVNHNCYRLDNQGSIVWQVQRDDSNHPSDWWDILHAQARAKGSVGAREPFTYIWVEHSDGYVDRDPTSRMPKDVQAWVPKCTIYLEGSAYQNYVLDPDTGIAKNITDWPVRPW